MHSFPNNRNVWYHRGTIPTEKIAGFFTLEGETILPEEFADLPILSGVSAALDYDLFEYVDLAGQRVGVTRRV
jgi:hypothetical protein